MKNFNLTFNGLVYEGAATNDPAQSDRLYNSMQETHVAGYVHYELPIANATTNQAITLPSASTTTYLIIFTDQTISINLNGDATAVQLKPMAAGFKSMCYMLRGPVTSLTVSNSSGQVANTDIILASF